MIFWALDNAGDDTVLFFGGILISCIIVMITVVLIDWIRKKWKKLN